MHRIFIALPLDNAVADRLGDMAAQIACQDKSGHCRWVDQENYHLTLAFLGDQSSDCIEVIANALSLALNTQQPLIKISRLSPFPERKPKLLAAMVEKTPDLMKVHQQVKSALRQIGLTGQRKRFAPHITLARYRVSRPRLSGWVAGMESIEFFAQQVILYESFLNHQGAKYQPIYEFPLCQ